VDYTASDYKKAPDSRARVYSGGQSEEDFRDCDFVDTEPTTGFNTEGGTTTEASEFEESGEHYEAEDDEAEFLKMCANKDSKYAKLGKGITAFNNQISQKDYAFG
jgi:hypothetical protein